jgi:hypothetical protein
MVYPKRLPSQKIAHRALPDRHFVCHLFMKTDANACLINYAVKEVPQPQLPVAFGFVNVKPEPITPVT